MPWDYDGAWALEEYLGKDEYGISVWWESPLHKKFLTKEKNREDVYAMAEEIRSKYITNEKIQAHLDEYNATVEHFSYTEPDSQNNSLDSWQYATEELVTGIDKNMALYKSVIGHPMPFHEHASYSNNKLDMSWDEAIDFEGDAIVYDVNVSSDMHFTTNLVEVQDLNTTALSANITLAPGIYYLKVVAREKNDPTHYQIAFEKVFADDVAYGVLEFEVQ
jgi:spore coat protein H